MSYTGVIEALIYHSEDHHSQIFQFRHKVLYTPVVQDLAHWPVAIFLMSESVACVPKAPMSRSNHAVARRLRCTLEEKD